MTNPRLYPMQSAYEVYWKIFQSQFPTTAQILQENPLLNAAFQNAFFEGYNASELHQGSTQ